MKDNPPKGARDWEERLETWIFCNIQEESEGCENRPWVIEKGMQSWFGGRTDYKVWKNNRISKYYIGFNFRWLVS